LSASGSILTEKHSVFRKTFLSQFFNCKQFSLKRSVHIFSTDFKKATTT